MVLRLWRNVGNSMLIFASIDTVTLMYVLSWLSKSSDKSNKASGKSNPPRYSSKMVQFIFQGYWLLTKNTKVIINMKVNSIKNK